MNRCPLVLPLLACAGASAAAMGSESTSLLSYRPELRADAATRTSLGDQIVPPISIDVRTQIRYLSNISDGFAGDDELVTGFQVSRTRLELGGDLSDRISYEIQIEGDRDGGAVELIDVEIDFELTDHLDLRVGQYRMPFSREQNTSAYAQLAIDRSITDDTFAFDRVQGATLTWQQENLRFASTISDGGRTDNTDYTNPEEADIALTSRIDFAPVGTVGQFRDLTAFPETEFGVLLGGGVHWQTGGSTGVGPTDDVEIFALTADAGLEGDGWNAMLAGHYQRTTEMDRDLNDLAFLVQGGLFVADDVELYGRYDHIFPDGDRDNDADFKAFTAGVNWYILPRSQRAKLTIEGMYMPDAQSEGIVGDSPNLGVIESDDEQTALRIQIQIQS